jgi:DNA-binding PadR family transcriptional regulator
MNTPFTPQDGPFAGRPGPGPFAGGPAFGADCGPGFGFGPDDRHDLREHRRHLRRELRDQIRGHRGGPFGPAGPGGPGFGREFPGFGPEAGGPGFGRGRRGGRRGSGGRGRRGDVRAAILKLLAERPMHGYEMIQQIAERSNDLWKPSPGSVYPTLQLLEDEGLIAATDNTGTKKLFELTEDGRTAAEAIEKAPWTEITEGADPAQVTLRDATTQLFGAVRQSAFAASSEQQQRIVDILNNARREIYQILGEN